MRHPRPDYNRIQDPAAVLGLADAIQSIREALEQEENARLAEDRPRLADVEDSISLILSHIGDVSIGEGSRPIGVDEPVFLLRASDVTAPDAVRAWARLQYSSGGIGATETARREMARVAMNHADAMEDWQRQNGAKVPDMPTAREG